MSIVVLDTDVASAILRGRVDERLRARLTGRTLGITFVTLGELTKWTVVRSWGPRRLADLARWRRGLVLLHRLPLATYNGKDYADFAEHDRLRLLDLA
ncbi:type II toxin-antitoxin system VapC family toxin [Micromonospora sp. WMMC241]|uniref:type II toxin-antitoxin system VapC family toxin n=1 Tax=Micromonospora sp. WMMC241 TaxID=3015159 RepID=UPI0022B64E54|nr:type II toxin-antitoxin system VapC family toxin [Micromonospora sp. WMMC241]MCZ7439175.1 type II toxin-antitoxin system VapC family toxin [Micromonospora sp. WMMC241]